MRKNTCCKCNNPLEETRIAANQRYCKSCHAEYMRLHRPRHSELSPIQRMKSNARSYLNEYLQRGKVKKTSCQHCGDSNVEAHHEDYSKPLDVIWLCRSCHLELHKQRDRKQKAIA